MTKPLKITEYVKVNSRGRIVLRLDGALIGVMLDLIEMVLNANSHCIGIRLDATSCEDKTYHALISEVYIRHFTVLNALSGPAKMHLTVPQAYAFWIMSTRYDNEFYKHPQMGALLMQLHQRLS